MNPMSTANTITRSIPIELVRPNPANVRMDIDDAAIAALAESVKASGILQPLLVTPESDHFLIVAGHRRHAAAKLAGLAELPCVVRTIAAENVVSEMLVENLQRENLSPIEEARGFDRLADQGLTQAEIARRLGLKPERVAVRLKLLKLPEELQQCVHRGALHPAAAEELLRIGNPDVQKRLGLIAMRGRWSADRIRSAVDRDLQKIGARPPKPKPTWKESTSGECGRARDKTLAWLHDARGSVSFSQIAAAAERSCDVCGMAESVGVCQDCPMLELLDQLRPAALAQTPVPIGSLRAAR
jgi:ParB family chromosome partitioning protein